MKKTLDRYQMMDAINAAGYRGIISVTAYFAADLYESTDEGIHYIGRKHHTQSGWQRCNLGRLYTECVTSRRTKPAPRYIVIDPHTGDWYAAKSTLHAAKLWAARNAEMVQTLNGWRESRPNIYDIEDCIETEDGYELIPGRLPAYVWAGRWMTQDEHYMRYGY